MSIVYAPVFNIGGVSEGESDVIAAAIQTVWPLDDFHVFDGEFSGLGQLNNLCITPMELRDRVQKLVSLALNYPVEVEMYDADAEGDDEIFETPKKESNKSKPKAEITVKKTIGPTTRIMPKVKSEPEPEDNFDELFD